MRRYSGQILFDEFAIPVGYISWRRPDSTHLKKTLEHDRGNLLYKESMKFANELKVMCIFAPEAYVDPFWLLNNPKLMYLSNLSRGENNCIAPVFSNKFFVTYWGLRKPHNYERLFKDTYPESGEPSLPSNSSYIDDIYYKERRFFEKYLRRPLTNYVTTCLPSIDQNRELDTSFDPSSKMKFYVLDVRNNPSRHIPFRLKEEKSIEILLRNTAEFFLANDLRFNMTTARNQWRKLAKNKHVECLSETNQRIIDWIFRNSVYLRAHSDVTNGIPVGYTNNSADIDTLHQVSQGALIEKKGEKMLNFLGSNWHIYYDHFDCLPTYLSNLSFKFIFGTIRKESFYKNYEAKMEEIRKKTYDDTIARDTIVRETIDAYNYLFGCLVPMFRKKKIDPIFREKLPWNILGWYIDKNKTLSSVMGVASWGGAEAINLTFPFSIIAGIISTGMVSLPFQFEEINVRSKRLRGRRMLMTLAKTK